MAISDLSKAVDVLRVVLKSNLVLGYISMEPLMSVIARMA